MYFIMIYKEWGEAGVKHKTDKFRKALCDGKAAPTLGEHLALARSHSGGGPWPLTPMGNQKPLHQLLSKRWSERGAAEHDCGG